MKNWQAWGTVGALEPKDLWTLGMEENPYQSPCEGVDGLTDEERKLETD
jgi:hypothetical protein